MRRREFVTLIGGAAVAWPPAARGQQATKLPTIGFLGAATPSVASQWLAAFLQRLQELGWSEDRNIRIEVRWAEGHTERFAEIAAEFVRLKVDVVVTWGTLPALVAKEATSVIPVVFALVGDPLGTGLVASLARPGGNLTGLSLQNVDLAGKRFEILREVVPNLGRLAIMANVDVPDVVTEMHEVQAVASRLAVDVSILEVRGAKDITSAFEALKVRADALYVIGDPLTYTNRTQINTLALSSRLPTLFAQREYVTVGGLMSYGANFPDLFKRAADLADKILRGTKPADIPVEQPSKFDFVINLTTAKALGLTIPHNLLVLADEVIE